MSEDNCARCGAIGFRLTRSLCDGCYLESREARVAELEGGIGLIKDVAEVALRRGEEGDWFTVEAEARALLESNET